MDQFLYFLRPKGITNVIGRVVALQPSQNGLQSRVVGTLFETYFDMHFGSRKVASERKRNSLPDMSLDKVGLHLDSFPSILLGIVG
jgi:hypothetical protein